MKITKLRILNFLGISRLSIDRCGKINRITGGNGTGKSSVLKAITAAFKSSGVDPMLIRTDEDKAEILIELDNNVTIERTMTSRTNTARVTVGQEPVSSPQTYLKSLFSSLSFNPVEFFLADKKERRRLLLQAIPFQLTEEGLKKALDGYVAGGFEHLDLTRHGLVVIDDLTNTATETRKLHNRQVKELQNSIALDRRALPDPLPDVEKFREFDYSKVAKQLEAARIKTAKHEQLQAEVTYLQDSQKTTQERLIEIAGKIEELKLEHHTTSEADKEMAQRINTKQKELDIFEVPPIKEIEQEIDQFVETRQVVLAIDQIEEREKHLTGEVSKAQELDDLVKALSKSIPRKLLAAVKMPVEGLAVSGGDITVGGVALDTLSTSEQMKLGVTLAKKLSGDLKVICVDRFESLQESARKVFEEEAMGDEFEYFITQVTDGNLDVNTDGGNNGLPKS